MNFLSQIIQILLSFRRLNQQLLQNLFPQNPHALEAFEPQSSQLAFDFSAAFPPLKNVLSRVVNANFLPLTKISPPSLFILDPVDLA